MDTLSFDGFFSMCKVDVHLSYVNCVRTVFSIPLKYSFNDLAHTQTHTKQLSRSGILSEVAKSLALFFTMEQTEGKCEVKLWKNMD